MVVLVCSSKDFRFSSGENSANLWGNLRPFRVTLNYVEERLSYVEKKSLYSLECRLLKVNNEKLGLLK